MQMNKRPTKTIAVIIQKRRWTGKKLLQYKSKTIVVWDTTHNKVYGIVLKALQKASK